jgi:hypothetical protein
MAERNETRWLLLIHQIPPKPDYFRVKIWRRLQKIGAVAIKNSVYALPRSEQALEDFQWILREVIEGGGDASICEAGFVEGLSDEQVVAMFRAARDADYGSLVGEAREVLRHYPASSSVSDERRGELESGLARLTRRLEEAIAIDFFHAIGRETAEALIGEIEARLRTPKDAHEYGGESSLREFRARTWVTRKGIHVDRIASAWLIQRFIDPAARFKFVPARGYRPEAGEFRFDMFEAEFTHDGDECTFEVLLRRMKLADPALRPIAEIVHDIDLKDGKFGRPETPGIERMITGICMAHKDDETRLSAGEVLFGVLYQSFTRKNR